MRNLLNLFIKKLITNPRFEKVEHNVTLDGKDGPRQIDVLLTTTTVGMQLKTVIECKDYTRKVSIGVVESFVTKLEDVNANKGIMVARKGFSSKAFSLAKRKGITLCTAHEALSTKWDIPVELPILITEGLPTDFEALSSFSAGHSGYFDNNSAFTVNGLNILKLFADKWRRGDFNALLGNLKEDKVLTLKFDEIKPPYYMRDTEGRRVQLSDFNLRLTVKLSYYFGYINEVENTQLLVNITEGHNNLFVDSKLLFDYSKMLRKLPKSEVPAFDKLLLNIRVHPLRNVGKPGFDLITKKKKR